MAIARQPCGRPPPHPHPRRGDIELSTRRPSRRDPVGARHRQPRAYHHRDCPPLSTVVSADEIIVLKERRDRRARGAMASCLQRASSTPPCGIASARRPKARGAAERKAHEEDEMGVSGGAPGRQPRSEQSGGSGFVAGQGGFRAKATATQNPTPEQPVLMSLVDKRTRTPSVPIKRAGWPFIAGFARRDTWIPSRCFPRPPRCSGSGLILTAWCTYFFPAIPSAITPPSTTALVISTGPTVSSVPLDRPFPPARALNLGAEEMTRISVFK